MSGVPPSPTPPTRELPAAGSRFESGLLWLALAAAFSPVLFDLVRHVAATRWAHYVVVFPPLVAWCALRERSRPRREPGGAWIATGLALEVVAGFLGAIRWARPGLLLALFGMFRREGIASWPTRALCVFAIPAPAFLVRLGSGPVAYAMTDAVAAVWRGLGLAVSVDGGIVYGAGGGVLVVPDHDWLFLAPLLVGLAWYAGIRLRLALAPSLLGCAAAAALALPIQTAALFAAVGIAAAGWPAGGQALVDHGSWIATALAVILATERRARRRWDLR